jgi:hypothetical protein
LDYGGNREIAISQRLQAANDVEKVDLSIGTPTNLRGDVDPKDVYNAFSEVAEYV